MSISIIWKVLKFNALEATIEKIQTKNILKLLFYIYKKKLYQFSYFVHILNNYDIWKGHDNLRQNYRTMLIGQTAKTTNE